jgi:acyl carrier protein
MGLDSVELVMDFETFFNFKMPDVVSEKLRTVQDAVSYISSQITFVNAGVDIKSDVAKQLARGLDIAISDINLSDKIDNLIPCNNEEGWIDLASKLSYSIPFPFPHGKFNKYLDKLFPSNRIDYQNTTVDRFLDLICAVNYKKLIVPGKIQNEYEVLIGVMGLTIDKLGVDPYDVFATSNFVNDLGLD